jgi:hypothetical protein
MIASTREITQSLMHVSGDIDGSDGMVYLSLAGLPLC